MRDLLSDCMSSPGVDAKASPADFKQVVCRICRQGECVNAGWAKDRFTNRVSTQVERLFNPLQLDPTLPKYARITEADFKDMLGQAMVLEIADRRRDWSIPEVPILDGRPQASSTTTTSAVDDAIKTLATAQGRKVPKLVEGLDPDLPKEKGPEPEPEPAPKHPKNQPLVIPKKGNTPAPTEGIMIGGGPPPARQSKVPEPDPWAVPLPGPKKVKPGTKIQFNDKGEVKS